MRASVAAAAGATAAAFGAAVVLALNTAAGPATVPTVTASPTPSQPVVNVGGSGCLEPTCYITSSRTSGCRTRARGQLPDLACTPGAFDPTITKEQVCNGAAAARPRRVSDRLRRQVLAAYGVDPARFHGEIDHYGSRELGGLDVFENLWPETGKIPNPKDAVENSLRRRVCAGTITLRQAQLTEVTDWRAAR